MRPSSRLIAVAFTCLITPAAMAEGRITVTGVGESFRAPDMANLSLGAGFEAETAAEAMNQVSEALSTTLMILAKAGVAPEDVQTQRLNLNPVYPDRPSSGQRQAGAEAFRAESGLSVVIRELDTLGSVLDAVLSGGANQFGGVSFGLQDPRPAEDEARAAAVADATRKAQLLAEAAGLSLGPVQMIREQGDYGVPMPMAEFASARDGVPIAQGQLTISISVSMEWELVEDLD